MKKRIVFVDDERPILRAIRRMLFNEPYDCHFFDNGFEALEYMEAEGGVDLIITDMRMPEMDGLALLKQVKYKYPNTMRVVLSGYTDNKIIMNVLEENYSQFYLHKPFKNEDLLSVIRRLLSMQDKMMSERLRLKIEEIGSLPTLPLLYRKITGLIGEDAPVDGIINIINEDFVITGNILHVANSAYYGTNASTIKQAVMMLGLNNIQHIIVATEVFKNSKDKIGKLKLWEHAFLTNQIATYLHEKRYSVKMPVNASSAGMMHSIGIVLMLSKFSDKYDQIIKLKEESDKTIAELEGEILGVDHMELGGFLMNWWEMSLPAVEAALYYRDPENDNCLNVEVIQIIHVAAHLAWKILGQDIFNYPLNEKVVTALGVNDELIESLVKRFGE